MFGPIVLGQGRGTLQAEVCRGELGNRLAVGGLGRLGNEGRLVEDGAEDRLVVLDRGIGRRLVLVEKSLEVFCDGQFGVRGHGKAPNSPQPYIGVPGWGALTL